MVSEKKFQIYVTRRIPEVGISALKERGYQVDWHDSDLPVSREILENMVQNADGLICMLSDTIDKELILKAKRLKIIANYAAGFNNIDAQFAHEYGVAVSNTPDILTAATADLTWALILAVSKRVVEGHRMMQAGQFTGWSPLMLLGGDVTGKTLGIIGAGRIGQAVAQRASGFNMQICYHNPRPVPEFEKRTGAQLLPLAQLLAESDFISVHCPLNRATHHLIHSENILSIRHGAYLINTARGSVIEEKALIAALKSGRLAGAGLDVYEFEPQVSAELQAMDQVVLLPHIGSATFETRSEMARIAARNIIAVLETGRALNAVV
jgi:glyoxylate reductase